MESVTSCPALESGALGFSFRSQNLEGCRDGHWGGGQSPPAAGESSPGHTIATAGQVQTTTPCARLHGDPLDAGAGTTFPSGSSRRCTCSVRLPAAPGAAPGAAQGRPVPLWCCSGCGSRLLRVRVPLRLLVQISVQTPVRVPVRCGRSRPLGVPTVGPEPSFPRAGSMPRGRAWTQAEVSSLLALVGSSGEAALLMASTSRPNEALWREISQGLAAAGYSRSVAQCRSKWKALKQAFHSERETRQRAGHHSARLPPHYRAMKSIWKAAGRPVFGERRMPDMVKLPSRKRRSARAACSSSSPEPRGICGLRQPEWGLSWLWGVRHGHCFPPLPFLGYHTALKQEGAEQKAGFPGETSLGMARGSRALPVPTTALCSPGMAAVSEQPAASEEASDSSLHGSGVAGLLQSVQQLLVQILQTSRQQQALLESLASDTVSHLHLLSHSLVQVGETLHQLLLRPQTHPGALGHYIPHVPLFEGGPRAPCSPGDAHTSPDHKEEPRGSPDTGCTPP
ncbi:LOW QUALITY PROTEIN: uncharacterized protein AAGF69_016167 [Amazona ochrocephala]